MALLPPSGSIVHLYTFLTRLLRAKEEKINESKFPVDEDTAIYYKRTNKVRDGNFHLFFNFAHFMSTVKE